MFDMSPALDRLRDISDRAIAMLPTLVMAVIVFVVFLIIAKLVRSGAHRITVRRVEYRTAGMAVGRLAQGVVILIGILISLSIALPAFKPADIVRFLGIGSVAIGFAFRDILQNFLAGILLLITHPFRLGDQIATKDYEGTVEDIQTRATFIRTYDGRRVVIPNADLFTDVVVVNTAFDIRRVEYDIGIGYGDDAEEAKAVILQALRGIDEVLSEPAPDTLIWELADSSVKIRVRWWIRPPQRAEVLDARDRVLSVIKQRLQQKGIDLPFPTTQVLFHDQTEEFDGDRSRQREGWPAGHKEVPAQHAV